MDPEIEEQDIYVYLDFQGKDTSTILRQDNVYFRMLNLSENKPIVEIGEDVYEGTYDDAIGTNLFFEEVSDNPRTTDLFDVPTPVTLEFILKQNKLLKVKKIGTRQKIILDVPQTETVNINIKDDYRILLEKFENNNLNIDEYIVEDGVTEENEVEVETNVEENELNTDYKWELQRSPPRQNLTPNWYKPTDNTDQEQAKLPLTNPVNLKYTKLQKIAEQPSKRLINQETIEPNNIEQPLPSIPKNDFIIWKNLMMKKVEHQVITVDVRKEKVEDFVDVEQSIKDNVISPSSEKHRNFTKEEKAKLLSFENFANVSPLMKLIMLQDLEDTEKNTTEELPPEELNKLGDDGYSPLERYQLIKVFKEELKSYLVARLRDEYENSGVATAEINLDVTLSDTEINYYSSSSISDDEDEENNSKFTGHVSSSNERYGSDGDFA